MEDTLVPMLAIIFTFGAPAAVVWQIVVARHKERQMIIERGLDPTTFGKLHAQSAVAGSPMRALKWALILIFVGVGLWLGGWLVQVYRFPETTQAAVTLLGGGVGFFLYYLIASRKNSRDTMSRE